MQANHPSIDVCMVFTNTNMFYKDAVEFGLGCALITDVDQFWYGMMLLVWATVITMDPISRPGLPYTFLPTLLTLAHS